MKWNRTCHETLNKFGKCGHMWLFVKLPGLLYRCLLESVEVNTCTKGAEELPLEFIVQDLRSSG